MYVAYIIARRDISSVHIKVPISLMIEFSQIEITTSDDDYLCMTSTPNSYIGIVSKLITLRNNSNKFFAPPRDSYKLMAFLN